MRQFFLNIIICILLFMMIYPLFLTLGGSLKNELDWAYHPWWPTIPLKIENLFVAWGAIHQYIWNTVIVAGCGTAGLLVQASWGAYVFARMRFFGKETMYMGVLSLMMVPAILTIVPSYLIYSHMGLINTLWVLIIPQWTVGPVFGIFLLRGFFQTTPEEIFEAARMDGCGDFRLFGSISLPLSYPILTTLAIMNVVGVWNDLIWPSITIHDSSKMTIAYGLVQAFSTTNTTNMPDTFAGYVLASIPLLVIFAFASKYYVEGLTSSAIKL